MVDKVYGVQGMSLTPLRFTGASSYSADLQKILERTVAIASLPLTQLQNEATDNLEKKTVLAGLGSVLSGLERTLRDLSTIAHEKALSVSTSSSAQVTATYAGATSPATYVISEITSIASAASETSLAGYADSSTTPVSSTGTVKLIAGSEERTIVLDNSTNNLVGLRDAINDLNIGVTASILTTGTGPNPNYLSVTYNATGATTLALKDDPAGVNTDLLTASNQGSNASFKLNGILVDRESNQVNDVISGLTFTIRDTTAAGETVSLTLQTDRSKLSSALDSFASAYNAVAEQLALQIGPAAGLLSGDAIVIDAQRVLRELAAFQGNGGIGGLADLGLEFDPDGRLRFNSAAVGNLSDSQLTETFAFLNDSDGLGTLAGDLAQIADPASGLIAQQLAGFDRTDLRLSGQIAELEERISFIQQSAAEKLQFADALLAQLDAQQNLLTGSLKAVSLALFGKNKDDE